MTLLAGDKQDTQNGVGESGGLFFAMIKRVKSEAGGKR